MSASNHTGKAPHGQGWHIPVSRGILVGPAAKPVIALYPAHYLLERQADGDWKIAGCYLVPAPDENV